MRMDGTGNFCFLFIYCVCACVELQSNIEGYGEEKRKKNAYFPLEAMSSINNKDDACTISFCSLQFSSLSFVFLYLFIQCIICHINSRMQAYTQRILLFPSLWANKYGEDYNILFTIKSDTKITLEKYRVCKENNENLLSHFAILWFSTVSRYVFHTVYKSYIPMCN